MQRYMIYTVTFNPALDYVVAVEHFTLGSVNRTIRENIFYGGKGINVSALLANLGYRSTALGFIAGSRAGRLSGESGAWVLTLISSRWRRACPA